MNKISFLPNFIKTAIGPTEFIRRENSFAPDWPKPKLNRFGYVDNSYTKMFGFPERGGSAAGELMHKIQGRGYRLGGFQAEKMFNEGKGLYGEIKDTFGSLDRASRYKTLWQSGNATGAIKEFPGILESSTSYGSRPVVDRALSFLPKVQKFVGPALRAGARFGGPVGLALGAHDFMDNFGGLPWSKPENRPQPRTPSNMSSAELSYRTGPRPQFNTFK